VLVDLDVHWIYPGAIELGASADSKQRFTSLIKVPLSLSIYFKFKIFIFSLINLKST
jgi:hypothetical protein